MALAARLRVGVHAPSTAECRRSVLPRPTLASNPSLVNWAAAKAPCRPTSSRVVARASSETDASTSASTAPLVGEDSAAFDLSKQSLQSWGLFTVLLSTVLGALYLVWIQPAGFADDYLAALESWTSGNPEATMALILLVFAIAHSGLAGLRPYGEKVIGARAYRVIFALVSLPLALVSIVYFINHRYDGVALWDVRDVPGVHSLVWIVNFISFYFLYPSTFNILEVAAVDEPKLHLWETGIMRITRHPQMVGQGLWCAAHTLWVGSSVMLVASAGLMAHHLFGCWHGDRRLKAKYGDAFEAVKARTSVLPFAAIADGRQQLPADYWKEFLRMPYVAITILTLGAYWAHPIMQSAAFNLHW
ncbi:hypothetical protein HYH03_011475 [Edaphochlamys debaryana]|uniref:NnrU domain-containing protein n=1 Tax=Edaphochlamys debaryana TaxID=47281 RepID=A0A835XZY9_9CHLO|nr:hypothetical protein HYH03_011475 [Edaphochlamys debaryana]|eukprot:KAG2490010.1 hypothetical protein HYH03_011475 [Edaphochlamys debaryana]